MQRTLLFAWAIAIFFLLSCRIHRKQETKSDPVVMDCNFNYLFLPDSLFHSGLSRSLSFINYENHSIQKWGSRTHFFSKHRKIDTCTIETTHVLYYEREKSDTVIFLINYCDPKSSFLYINKNYWSEERNYYTQKHFDTLDFHFKHELPIKDSSVVVYRFSSNIVIETSYSTQKLYTTIFCVPPIGPVFYYGRGTSHVDFMGINQTKGCLEELYKSISKDSILTRIE